MELKIGSRDSLLAVAQSKLVMDCIAKNNPEIKLELVTMKTTGDIILDKTLDKIGGKGLFVKELDHALMDKKVDITVHSCKDLPMELPENLPLLAFSDREDPRDVLILPQNKSELDFTKPIGCSSKRRALQLKEIFPQATVAPIRGNVQTRLAKLDSGEFGALVLAAAGLHRLELHSRISRYFSTDEILPAGGQGIVVVQGHIQNTENTDCLKHFNNKESCICALAERSFVAYLDGGCSSPVGAYAQVIDNKIYLQGMNANGKKGYLWGDIDKAVELGRSLGEIMKQ